MWNALGAALPVLAALVAIGAILVLFRNAALWGRGTVGMRIGATYHSIGTTFASLSIWLLLSGLCILAANAGTRARNAAIVIIASQVAIAAFLGFHGANPRSEASAWTSTLHAGVVRCERTRSTIATVYVVPPSPAFATPIKCADLRRSGHTSHAPPTGPCSLA